MTSARLVSRGFERRRTRRGTRTRGEARGERAKVRREDEDELVATASRASDALETLSSQQHVCT